ncbi:MAG: enoyl-CoA hydratase/isomerase family protein [Anaerolineae bacterium]
MSFKNILWEKEGAVAKLTIARPPLNILDIATMKEIDSVLASLEGDAETKVLVLTGEGKAFSAGVDVADHTEEKVDEMMTVFHRICRRLFSLGMPTVAVLNGMALGGGCELAVCCDLVIASEKARIGQPEITVGVFPPVAAVVFPRLLGRFKTLELLLTGEAVEAREAERIGLISKAVPHDQLQTATDELVGKLTGMSGVLLRLTKQAVYQGLDLSFDAALDGSERIYLEELMKTEDVHEGLQAFMEKRPPVWKDR